MKTLHDAPPPLAPDMALFFDFDGTLVELAARPDAIIIQLKRTPPEAPLNLRA